MTSDKPGAPALQAAPFDHPAWPSRGAATAAEPESPESPNSGAAPAAANLARALQYHRSGKIGQAAALYRQVLAAEPENPDALHLLGVTMHQNGEHRAAAEHIERAIAIRPGEAAYHNNLGSTLNGCGEPDKAASAYEQAIELDPAYAEALLGLAGLRLAGDGAAEALALAERSLAHQSGNAEASRIMGCALAALDRLEEAGERLEQALALAPDHAEARSDLGTLRRRQWRPDEALTQYRKAVALVPDSAIYRNNLGVMLADLGQAHEAIEQFEAGLAIDPGIAELHCHYAMALTDTCRLAKAVEHLEQALTLDPGLAMAHHALVSVLVSLGRIDRALHHHDRGVALAPDDAGMASNRMFILAHTARFTDDMLAAAFRDWDKRFAQPVLPANPRHGNDPDPDRKLRVGYVSPDFREHAVADIAEPLIAAHDRDAVEIFCYAEIAAADGRTDRFEALADHWRPTVGLSDEALAAAIRDDRIDILVDLAGHTANNRLLAFARKPAPVQVAHLVGMGQTTGLSAMDYVLADPWIVGEGGERAFSETVFRLDRGIISFAPRPTLPQVSPLPARERGHVTFATFNNPSRITPETVALWTRVLQAVPGARMLIKHPALADEAARARLEAEFGAAGILGRVDLEGVLNGWAAESGIYARIDAMLDTTPLNGGTPNLIALWMGLPLVTLAGAVVRGRTGLLILKSIGFDEGIAVDEAEFVARAAALAGDLDRLAELRAGLRERMRTSPLLDHAGMARAVEAAYRAMWRKWCEAQATGGSPGGN